MSITVTEPTQMQTTKGEEEPMFAKHCLPHTPTTLPEPWTTVSTLKALSWQKTTWQEAWHTSTSNVQTLQLTYGSARVWREDQVMWVRPTLLPGAQGKARGGRE